MPPRSRPGAGGQQRAAAGRPAPAAPADVVDQPADDVVFSVTDWLASKGLTGARAVEVGGQVFRIRNTLDLPETAQLMIALRTGANSDALTILLEDGEQLPQLLTLLRIPVNSDAEDQFWADFFQAVAGVDLGEQPAS